MTDLATLGLRIESRDVDSANRRLDDLTAKSGKAQKATDALGDGSKRASGAVAQMVAAVLKAVEAVDRNTAAVTGLTAAQSKAAVVQVMMVKGAQQQAVAATEAAGATKAQAAASDVAAAAIKAQTVAVGSAAVANRQYSSEASRMAGAIAAQDAALRTQALSSGSAAASAKANAEAVMALGKATSVQAEEARLAAVAQSNVANILSAGGRAAKGASGEHQALAASLGLTAFQMRQVAIQAPDVVQGLLSGQRPLQILIQQGGQVAQILGMGPNGFGGVLRALVPLLGGFLSIGGLAVLVGTLATAFAKGRKEAADFANAIAATNGYAGVTAANYEDMARRIAKASDSGIGQAKQDILQLIATGQYTGQTLENIATYSAKFAQLTGADASKVAASFASMKDNVTAFAVKHAQQYHDLTQAQINYIAQLQAAGRLDDAAQAATRAMADAVQKQTVQYGLLEKAVHGVKNAASEMWDALLGIGKPKTLEDNLAEAQRTLEEFQRKNAKGVSTVQMQDGTTAFAKVPQSSVESQRNLVAELQFAKDAQDALAKKQAGAANVTNPLAANSQLAGLQASVDQALATRAQAEAALTADVLKQAALQKEAIRYQLAADHARLKQQTASVQMDADLNAAQKASIIGAMNRAAGINAEVAKDRARLIDLQAQDAIQKQAVEIANAQRDASSAILDAQLGITTDIAKRAEIETRLLELADQKAIADAQSVIDSAKIGQATKAQAIAAQAQIDAINGAHGYKQQAIDQAKQAALVHQQADAAQSALQNQADILEGQTALAETGSQRLAVEEQLLGIQQAIALSKAQEAVAAANITGDEVAIATTTANLRALMVIQTNQRDAFHLQATRDAFDALSGSVETMAQAVSQHDWVSLVNSMAKAFDAAKVAFSSAASAADRAKGIGGLAGSVGNAIGGQVGSAISGIGAGFGAFGAASSVGAAATAAGEVGTLGTAIGSLAGPIGLVVGGISLLSALGIGKNDTRRDDAAKAADAAALKSAEDAATAAGQAMTETLQKLADAQSQYNTALIGYLQASGQAEAATAEQRKEALAAANDNSKALLQATYAWQDYNDVLTKATSVVTKAQQDVASAQSDLTAAYNAQIQAIQSAHDKFAAFADSLKAFRDGLDLSGSSALSPSQQYQVAKSQFESTAALAAKGNETALGNLTTVSENYLAVAKTTAKTATDYARDVAAVKRATQAAEDYSRAQVSVADQQLASLNAQVSGLININNSVLTVAQAINNLNAALGAQQAAIAQQQQVQATAPPTQSASDLSASAPKGPDWSVGGTLWTQWAGSGQRDNPANNRGSTVIANWDRDKRLFLEQYTNAQAVGSLSALDAYFSLTPGTAAAEAIKYGLPAFAKGGVFDSPTVGVFGEAGPETVMPLHRGADGSLGVRTSGNDNAELIAAIERLEARLASIQDSTDKTAGNTGEIKRTSKDLETGVSKMTTGYQSVPTVAA